MPLKQLMTHVTTGLLTKEDRSAKYNLGDHWWVVVNFQKEKIKFPFKSIEV